MTERTEKPHQRREARPQVRALCCQCGTLRTAKPRGAYTGESDGGERCLMLRKCRTCGVDTDHAWLRDDLADDVRAGLDVSLSQALSPAVTQLIDSFEACEVRVWSPELRWKEGQVAMLCQWLDDNTWSLNLNPAAHIVHLFGALEAAWCVLATTGRDVGSDSWWRSVAGTPDDEGRAARPTATGCSRRRRLDRAASPEAARSRSSDATGHRRAAWRARRRGAARRPR